MSKGVTLKDIYEITNRIEDKLEKMETRVSTLEIWKAELMGKMAIVTGVLTLAMSLAWDYIKNRFKV